MDFPAEQLRAFAAVVDAGTFEAAAARLHVTPSAVSQRIKALERQVGTVVVQRTKPAAPTAAGTVLLRLARQLDLLAAEAAAELSGTAKRAEPAGAAARAQIAIAVNADSLATWFPAALRALSTDEALELEILREDEAITTGHLRAGRTMAAVCTRSRAVQGCSVEPLGSMRYTAMAAPAFAARWFGPEAARGLGMAPVVNFDRNDAQQRTLLDRVAAPGARPPAHFVPDSSQFVAAITDGLGWGMVPTAQDPGDGSLVPLDPSWHQDVRLYWQRWKMDSPALERVTDAVRAAARRQLGPLAGNTESGECPLTQPRREATVEA